MPRARTNIGRMTCNARRNRLIRSKENGEEREMRLSKARERQFCKRRSETFVERNARLALERDRRRNQRKRESLMECYFRSILDRIRDSAQIERETSEERERRLSNIPIRQRNISSTRFTRKECELTLVKEEPADEPKESTCQAAEEVCDSITVKVEKEPEYEENSGENHRPQVQEPEYIEVKCEPLEEEEEATNVRMTREYSLGFW